MEIATSILGVPEQNESEYFYKLEKAKTDYFHIDLMDGKFVKENTLEKMKKFTDELSGITLCPLEIHLMCEKENIKKLVYDYEIIRPNIFMFHYEAFEKDGKVEKQEIKNMVDFIKSLDSRVGIAINPKTSEEKIYEFLPYISRVLVMGVNPGKGGQKLIEDTLPKMEKISNYIKENNLETEIEIDGGVNLVNIEDIKDYGAEIAAVGSCIINSKDIDFTMKELKSV